MNVHGPNVLYVRVQHECVQPSNRCRHSISAMLLEVSPVLGCMGYELAWASRWAWRPCRWCWKLVVKFVVFEFVMSKLTKTTTLWIWPYLLVRDWERLRVSIYLSPVPQKRLYFSITLHSKFGGQPYLDVPCQRSRVMKCGQSACENDVTLILLLKLTICGIFIGHMVHTL